MKVKDFVKKYSEKYRKVAVHSLEWLKESVKKTIRKYKAKP